MPLSTKGALIALRRRVGAAAAVALAALLWHLWQLRKRLPRNVNVWRGHWLLGGTLDVFKAASEKRHLQFYQQAHKRFGRTFAMWDTFANHIVMTMDRRNVEHVLKTNFPNYPKGPFLTRCFQDLLGRGIFNVDGEDWYRQRKTTSHMFTASLFKEHIWVVVRRNALKVRSILQAAKPGEQLDIFNLMNRFTLDSIGEIGFGKCVGSLEDPATPFLGSFDYAQQVCFERTFFPPFFDGLRRAGVLRWFGWEREYEKHLKRLDEFSRAVARELCGAMRAQQSPAEDGGAAANSEARRSFVGLFIADAWSRGEECSEQFLRDLVLNFLIAGRDTTAQGLSWTFYCLANHPEVEAKARDEINRVCGTEPSLESLRRLPYLTAVLNESLRLHPSVPMDIKYVVAEDTWPDGTVVTPGTHVLYNIYSMNRDEEMWGADAAAFRPERWLEMEAPLDSYAFPVFNAGPRECLGKRMAMVEMQALLAVVLPRVTLRLAIPADQVAYDTQLTLGMSSGLPCFVESVVDTE